MANEFGCNSFRLIPEATGPRSRYQKEMVLRRNNCLLPFFIFIVTAVNHVRLCYKLYDSDPMIKDLNEKRFEEIWNGEEIAMIRNKIEIKERKICRTCRE